MVHPPQNHQDLSQAEEIRLFLDKILGIYPTEEEQHNDEATAYRQAIVEIIHGDLDGLSLNDTIAVCVLVGRLKINSTALSTGN